uniref:BACK domain-containing protein n=1 Tax=Glossina pallidipes TaxID=7398 RepID=A0A1A9ZNX0_GLOPL
MNNTRHGFGICTYNYLIYVVGGWGASTVESYDPATNEWHLCQNIPVTVGIFNRPTLEENSVYSVTRASNGKNVLFRFDPRDDKWCDLNEMPGTSGQYELVSWDRTSFAIGKNNCKRLDIRVNRWNPMSCIFSKRIGFSAVIAAKDVYVFDRKETDRSQFNTSVERFDIHSKAIFRIDVQQIYFQPFKAHDDSIQNLSSLLSTVRRIIYQTCESVWEKLASICIALPNELRLKKILQDFNNTWSLPHFVDIMDSKRVTVVCPPRSGSMFYNFKDDFIMTVS